jgi:hypothetical protein
MSHVCWNMFMDALYVTTVIYIVQRKNKFHGKRYLNWNEFEKKNLKVWSLKIMLLQKSL